MDEKELISEFQKKYGRFSTFIGNFLWEKCIDAVQNKELLGHILFCNDVLQIAPVKTFLMAMNLTDCLFTAVDKQSIGAFWGFIFKEKLGYTCQRRQTCHISQFHTASVFFKEQQFYGR